MIGRREPLTPATTWWCWPSRCSPPCTARRWAPRGRGGRPPMDVALERLLPSVASTVPTPRRGSAPRSRGRSASRRRTTSCTTRGDRDALDHGGREALGMVAQAEAAAATPNSPLLPSFPSSLPPPPRPHRLRRRHSPRGSLFGSCPNSRSFPPSSSRATSRTPSPNRPPAWRRGDPYQTLQGNGLRQDGDDRLDDRAGAAPTLIIEPNKSLAAQLSSELRDLFPKNRVEFFVPTTTTTSPRRTSRRRTPI